MRILAGQTGTKGIRHRLSPVPSSVNQRMGRDRTRRSGRFGALEPALSMTHSDAGTAHDLMATQQAMARTKIHVRYTDATDVAKVDMESHGDDPGARVAN